ncbi:MAG: ribosome silencing factor [Flavobacteriales bacterium]
MLKNTVTDEQLVAQIIDSITDIKGRDIKVLDLRKIENAVTDFFVIATGTSRTQVDAIARSIERDAGRNLKQKPWHVEGSQHSEWILIDYASVVVHVFQAQTRAYYDLEGLWGDAEISEVQTQY